MVSDRFKQRLVGGLVLVALAVIFVPVLFNLQPSRPLDETTQIPEAPEIEPVTIDEPTKPVVVREPVVDADEFFLVGEEQPVIDQTAAAAMEEKSVADNIRPAEPPAAKPPAPAPGLNEDGLPESWLVQVASYREAATADKLVARLANAGFKAFVREARAGGTTVYRVFVGPHILRKNAEDEKKLIDASLGVKSIITPFEP